MSTQRRKIEVFKAGTHTASNGTQITFTAEQVGKMVKNYDGAKYPCPVVVGHPGDNAPAFGWAQSFAMEAGDVMTSEIGELAPAFVSAVQEGRYKRVSLALFGPDHPNNPVPGDYYPRHIGFLGGAAPAIPDLKPVAFAGTADKVVELEFDAKPLEDATAANFLQTLGDYMRRALDLPAPTFKAPTTVGKTGDVTVEKTPAQLQADLDARDNEITALKTKAAADAKKQRTDAAAAFCAKLVTAKRLKPADQPAFQAIVVGVLGMGEIEFAGADGVAVKQAPLAVLDAVFASAPVLLDTTEKTPAEKSAAARSPSFAAPTGFSVDTTQLAMRDKARAMAAAQKITFSAALDLVIAEGSSAAS